MDYLWIVVLAACLAGGAVTQEVNPPTSDVAAVRQLADNIQTFVLIAKEGMTLSAMNQMIADLRTAALPFLRDADAAQLQCEINTVLKTAAAATGSHEVLSVLFANDTSALLSGRLSLALTSLSLVSHQLIEELTVSRRIQPNVAAFVIVAQTAQSIITIADESLSAIGGEVSLDNGFYSGDSGLAWRESARLLQFDLSPLITAQRDIAIPLYRQTRIFCRRCIGVGF